MIEFNWTLKKKLLVAFLCTGLLPLLAAGTIVTILSVEALENGAYSQLESVREVKRREIENYFDTIHNQVLTLSESTMVGSAMQGFKKAFHNNQYLTTLNGVEQDDYHKKLKDYYENQFGAEYESKNNKSANTDSMIPTDSIELYRQYRYIAENKHPLGSKETLDRAPEIGDSYDRVHGKYHPIFRNFLRKFGYYDIFLVDPDTGHIVYSVFKELDYATSLLTGPYKNTNFADAFRRALKSTQSDTVVLEDFEPYAPSYEAGASFIASPIYTDGKLEGVLIFQMPVGRINDIMGNTAGLGKSGETYLIGSDKLMRSQSRFIEDNTIGKQKVDTPTVQRAINGENGYDLIADYRGISVLSSFAPVEIEGLDWGIIAEIDEAEAFASITDLHYALAITAILALLVVFVITFVVVRSVQMQLGGDPMEIQEIAEAIADNNLSLHLRLPKESSGVYSSMSRMRDNLRESIERDRQAAAETSRIKQALDSVSGNVMMADSNNNIIYLNDAIVEMFNDTETDIQKDIPSFATNQLIGSNIHQFDKGLPDQQIQVSDLTETHNTELKIGGRTLVFIANPVLSDENERLGTVVEWVDRTEEVAIQKNIEGLISAAQIGDLSQKMDLEGKQGFFLNLSKGMNQLIETVSHVFDQMATVMNAMSHGDLQCKMTGEHRGTFAEVQNNVNSTIDSLLEIVSNIRESADQITTGSDEITSGNNSLSERTEQQAASLEETASAIEELTSTVHHNADNAQRANQLADNARETAQDGGEIVANAVKAMDDIKNASNKISAIVGVIDEIAFQTNLLALNASVEAARAGEQGRGFSVVATEVRNLAQRSAASAKEIKGLIQDSGDKVDAGSKLVNKSGEALENIVTSVATVGDIIAQIAAASKEQGIGIDQVNQTVTNLDELTQQNAALAEQTSAASVSMNERATQMSKQVEFFQVETYSNGKSAWVERKPVTQLTVV